MQKSQESSESLSRAEGQAVGPQEEGRRLAQSAGRGMGRAFALRLAEEGARVGVLDLRQEDAAATVALLPNPAQHLALACNVSDSGAINAAFAQVHAALP